MTNNKQFVNVGNEIYQGGEWWCSAGGEHCADVIATALNEQSEKINELEKENQMIKQDNDLKFWKHQFMQQHNSTQLIMYELSLAIDKGYAVSEDFQKYLEGLKTKFDENIEKSRRLE